MLDVSGNVVGDNVEIQWTERGGPEVKKPNGPGGYGSKLLHRTLAGHLGGELEHDWSQQGLIVKLKISSAACSASNQFKNDPALGGARSCAG